MKKKGSGAKQNPVAKSLRLRLNQNKIIPNKKRNTKPKHKKDLYQ